MSTHGPPYNLPDSLISPSKARRDAALAADWSIVTSWLISKYSPRPVPLFERNEDTLHALRALIAANDAADAEAELLHRAREEELEALGSFQGSHDPARDLLMEIRSELSEPARQALTDLASSHVLLGTLRTDSVALGEAITSLAAQESTVDDHLHKISSLQSYLDKELSDLSQTIEQFTKNQATSNLDTIQPQTAQFSRETKLINLKMAEYRDRVASLERALEATADPSLEEVVAEERKVQALQSRIKGLEKQLREYCGLPPDLETTRAEYQRAQRELEGLKRKRDDLFEGLVEG